MEDIVGVKVEDGKRGRTAFLTWGRSFDAADSDPLQNAILKGLIRFGIADVKSIHVCENLQEVAGFPFFFEALSLMTMKGIPFGKKSYQVWRQRVQRGIVQGKEIYCLGFVKPLRRKRID